MTPSLQFLWSRSEVEAGLGAGSEGPRAAYAVRRGSMRAGIYAPRGTDPQSPHLQDELYIVASGSGVFVKNGEARPVKAEDLIFVEAGAEHRFERFTDDFAAWVVFWGPEGGEVREEADP